MYAVYSQRSTYLVLYRKWVIKVFKIKDIFIYMHVPIEKQIMMFFKGRHRRIKEFFKSMDDTFKTLEKGKIYKIKTHSKIYKRLAEASYKGIILIHNTTELKFKNISKLDRLFTNILIRTMILNFSNLVDKQRKYYIITFEVN